MANRNEEPGLGEIAVPQAGIADPVNQPSVPTIVPPPIELTEQASAPPEIVPEPDPAEDTDALRLEAMRVQARAIKQRREADRTSVVRKVDDAIRSFAQGASLQSVDEVAALMNTFLGNRDFQENLALEKARNAAIPPEIRIPGEIAGGITTGIIMERYFPGSGMSVARFGAIGATEGMLSGFFGAEGDIITRGAASGFGGLTGGMMGAAAPVVTEKVMRLVARMLGSPQLKKAGRKALEMIDDVLKKGDVTPERALARLQTLGDEGLLPDVDENLLALTRSAGAQVGPVKNRAFRVLNTRNIKQGDRIEVLLGETLSDESFLKTQANMLASRAKKARPLYKQAFEAGEIKTQAVLDLIESSRDVRSAIRQARRFPEYRDLPDNHIILLDKAYKNIGGKVEKAFRSGDKPLAKDLLTLKNSLKGAIIEKVPVYGKALDAHSSESAILDALEAGRKFIKEDVEVLDDVLKQMTEGEREAFIIGAAKSVRSVIGDAVTKGDISKRISNTKNKMIRMRSLFPNLKSWQKFKKMMEQEGIFARTEAEVLKGSRSAEKVTEASDLLTEAGFAARADPSGAFFALGRFLRSLPAGYWAGPFPRPENQYGKPARQKQ
jgi:hypothetical protein